MSTVIVAEKPSVARDIARVVGAGVKRDGYLESRDGKTAVTWAFGHLVRYAEPDDYGPPWDGKWSFQQLPMIPDFWALRVEGAAKQFGVLRDLMDAAELVICATDAGREGEHIFRLIYEFSGCKTPVQRLWVSSLTQEALRAGLQNLYPVRAFDGLAQAAQARAKADWLVGMNLTRAYTMRHGTLLSVGRVQTPTLALVVQRDREIEDFTPIRYHEVLAHLEPGFEAVYARPGEPDDKGRVQWVRRLERREDAEAIVRSARNRAAVVADVDTRRVRHAPPPLYDLTALQRDATERFGWSAAETLEEAQTLYEARLVTYPRTESRHLPEDVKPLLPDLLAALQSPYAAQALDYLKQGRGKVPGKAYIDTTKLTDHHAIIPTKPAPYPDTGEPASSLSADSRERYLYGLIVGRFMQVFYPDQVVEETTVRLDLSGHVFLASGRREVEAGWRLVDPPRQAAGEEAAAGDLPALRQGQHVAVRSLDVLDKATSPPRRYTDATLLAAMKNAGRQVEDAEKAEALKDTGGLGTAATRADMIEVLLKRGCLVRKRKSLVSTEKGRALVAAVADPLASPELTATWEQQLKDIEDGKGSAEGFLDAVACFVRELLPQVRQSSVRVPGNGAEKPIGPCPLCGKGVVERGKVFGCSAWRDTGCPFRVWKVVAGKKLSQAQARALLAKGQTPPIKGFKARSGKSFAAVLKLNGDSEVVFDFGDI